MSEISAQFSSTINGLEQEFSIIAHNLANAGTAGYKRRCNSFSKLMNPQGNETKAQQADLNTIFDFSQGNVTETGRSLDFALCGKGFFVVETPDGPLYTRNGVFHINPNGQMVDSSGRTVAGESAPISIPLSEGTSNITVASDGSISVNGSSVGKLKLVDFKDDEKKLTPVGLNCFSAPKGSRPQAAEHLIVKQGFQENSNVQLSEELVGMMMVSRLYEANMKFASAAKDISKSILSVAMG